MLLRGLIIGFMLVLLVAPLAFGSESDSIMGFTIFKDKVILVEYAKWSMLGDGSLPQEQYPDIWQRDGGRDTLYLVKDDAALASLKTICGIYNVKLQPEVNIELSIDDQQTISDSGVRTRSAADDVLARKARIQAATTIDDLKAEMLR